MHRRTGAAAHRSERAGTSGYSVTDPDPGDHPVMIHSAGRRLRVAFQRSGHEADLEALRATPTATPLLPMVDFVAYAEDCLLSGRVRLRAERLTDMLNEHDEVELVDVMVERLDAPGAIEVREVVVRRDEIVLVHATGPRGEPERRQRTRQHPVMMGMGRYDVRGYIHTLPGADPLTAIRRRKTMVPLTAATIDFISGGLHQRRRVGAVVINRDQIAVMGHALDMDLDTVDLPMPVDPLVTDFTGSILGRPGRS